MTSPDVCVTGSPSPSDPASISDALGEYNSEAAGGGDERRLAVLVRESGTGRALGGLSGRTSYGTLFVETFHLPPDLRGAGFGAEVLQAAEDEARRRGAGTPCCTRSAFRGRASTRSTGGGRSGRSRATRRGRAACS